MCSQWQARRPSWVTTVQSSESVRTARSPAQTIGSTAIRMFMKWGHQEPQKHDLSSLRVLGTVGEPINPEAWMWYHEHIGGERCPIVDTW